MLVIEYVLCEVAIVWSFFRIIPMFTEASSKGVLGLTDIDKVTYLASCCIDNVFGVAITGISQFHNAACFVVG